MFNFEKFRILDLDEAVPLVKQEDTNFDIKKIKDCRFVLGKDCFINLYYDKNTDEVKLHLSNPVISDTKLFGGQNPVPFESVDMNTVVENFIVFNHLVTQKNFFGKKNADAKQTHLLLSNIDKTFMGQTNTVPIQTIVSEDVYKKAIERAKKAFDKEQSEVFHSQTPEYDT